MALQQLARLSASRVPCQVGRRNYSAVTANLKDFGVEHIDADTRAKVYPKIGNRDIVGYGRSGMVDYTNDQIFPYPAIRFEANTPESQVLMEKSMGDWRQLSMEEQKRLYRHSFQKTFPEIDVEGQGEWRTSVSVLLGGIAVSFWMYIWMKDYVLFDTMPKTMTKEWQLANKQRQIAQRQGIVEGISSTWDYEANDWKK